MDATSPINLTGLPALSVPYGFSSEELPIGIQLVSKWFNESTILRLGALLERKARGFALHYRQAPDAREVFHSALIALVETSSQFQLHPAHCLWEIRPVGADKGRAVTALMQRPPFMGRLPIFIGDDLTDEDGMREARKHGGAGYRVDDVFGDTDGVRTWLRRSAELRNWAPLP